MAGYEILLLDDDSEILHDLILGLTREGFCVTCQPQGLEPCLSDADIADFDLIVARVVLPFDRLKNVFAKSKKLNPHGAAIVLSVDYDYTFPMEAFNLEIDDYIIMPCSLGELRSRVKRCLNGVKLNYLAALSNQAVSEVNRRAFQCLADAYPLQSFLLPDVMTLPPAARNLTPPANGYRERFPISVFS